MSKILAATCQAGVVKVGTAPVEGAVILSEGVAASEGVTVFDEDKTYYVAKTSPDLKTTLEKISSALGDIASAITSLDTRGFLIAATAGVPGPPALAGTVATINSTKGEIDALKANLK